MKKKVKCPRCGNTDLQKNRYRFKYFCDKCHHYFDDDEICSKCGKELSIEPAGSEDDPATLYYCRNCGYEKTDRGE